MPDCPNCHTAIPQNSNFCLGCGTPVPNAPVAVTPDRESRPGSMGRNIGRIAAIVVVISFFMPWVSCGGLLRQTSSGLELAQRGATSLWLIPILMVGALVLLFSKASSLLQEKKMSVWAAACGALSTLLILWYFVSLFIQLHAAEREMDMAVNYQIEFGGLASVAGSVVLALAALYYSLSCVGPVKLAWPPDFKQIPALFKNESR